MLKPSMFTEKLSATELLVMFPDQSGRCFVASNKKFDPFQFNHWKLALKYADELKFNPSLILTYDEQTKLIGWETIDKSLETPIKGKMLKAVEKLLKLPLGEPVKCMEKLRYARFFVHPLTLKEFLQQEVDECLEMGETFEPKYIQSLTSSIGNSPISLPENKIHLIEPEKTIETESSTTDEVIETESNDNLLTEPSFAQMVSTLAKANNLQKLVDIVQQFNPDFVLEKQTKKDLAEMIKTHELSLVKA